MSDNGSTRPPAQFPEPISLQIGTAPFDDLNRIAELVRIDGVSRAQLVRECIDEALHTVALRHGVVKLKSKRDESNAWMRRIRRSSDA